MSRRTSGELRAVVYRHVVGRAETRGNRLAIAAIARDVAACERLCAGPDSTIGALAELTGATSAEILAVVETHPYLSVSRLQGVPIASWCVDLEGEA